MPQRFARKYHPEDKFLICFCFSQSTDDLQIFDRPSTIFSQRPGLLPPFLGDTFSAGAAAEKLLRDRDSPAPSCIDQRDDEGIDCEELGSQFHVYKASERDCKSEGGSIFL